MEARCPYRHHGHSALFERLGPARKIVFCAGQSAWAEEMDLDGLGVRIARKFDLRRRAQPSGRVPVAGRSLHQRFSGGPQHGRGDGTHGYGQKLVGSAHAVPKPQHALQISDPQSNAIAIPPGIGRRPELNLRQSVQPGPLQGFAQDGCLDGQLRPVARHLVLAAAARAKVHALWHHAVWRGLEHAEAGACWLHELAGQGERHKAHHAVRRAR